MQRAAQTFKFFAGEALRVAGELIPSTRPGMTVDDGRPGHHLRPALFVETTNAMRINREEIFGPVASVRRVCDAMVNAPTAVVDPHVPLGGRKASSFGARNQGRYAAEFFITVKTA
jgi:alpha-ketoglutaric semialdehyde dehydrogenase